MATTLKVDEIVGLAGNSVEIPSGTTIANLGTATGFSASGGGILQVKQINKIDVQSASSYGIGTDITGLSLAITPAATGNKILVGFDMSYFGNDSNFHVERNGTKISVPTTSSGSRTMAHAGGCSRNVYELNSCSMQVLDAPSTTSSVTYNIAWSITGSSSTNYINRTDSDSDNANGERAISTMWLMEIASGIL